MAKKSFKATLPGTIHQKNNRWWWKVQLPGEKKVKDHGLKPEGKRYATSDAKVAEEIAREMWVNAIRAETEAKIRAEMAEEIEEQKVEDTEKLGDYDQAIEAEEEIKTEVEQEVKAEPEPEIIAISQTETEPAEIPSEPITTAICECCGKEDVPESELVGIDSGQRLCPDCLKMLRG